jgi:hypothetical protein
MNININLLRVYGATLLIKDDQNDRKMQESNDETDATVPDRVRIDEESNELLQREFQPLECWQIGYFGVGSPSLDSTRTIS